MSGCAELLLLNFVFFLLYLRTGGTSSRRGSRTRTTSQSRQSRKRSEKRGRSKAEDEEGEERRHHEGEDTRHDGNRSNTGTPMETELLQETIEEVGGSDPDFEGPARKKQKKKKSPPVGNT